MVNEMERVWVICAFVDIRGFGTWMYRATIPAEIKQPFIQAYISLFQKFVEDQFAVHCKYLGDGLLAIQEIPLPRRSERVFHFIRSLRCLLRKVRKALRACDHAPDGVRVRITEGYAYKIMVVDPNDPQRTRRIPEFIEYGINTAERLMEVNPDHMCVVTEGVAKALGRYRSVFRGRPLGPPSTYPKSVNREDLEKLWVLTF